MSVQTQYRPSEPGSYALHLAARDLPRLRAKLEGLSGADPEGSAAIAEIMASAREITDRAAVYADLNPDQPGALALDFGAVWGEAWDLHRDAAARYFDTDSGGVCDGSASGAAAAPPDLEKLAKAPTRLRHLRTVADLFDRPTTFKTYTHLEREIETPGTEGTAQAVVKGATRVLKDLNQSPTPQTICRLAHEHVGAVDAALEIAEARRYG